ncbi:MAG: hypothetical protein RIC56_00145 [Pseudomonadales bacterium]
MGSHVHRLVARYRTLSVRERALVALTLLAVTWAVWTMTLGSYLDQTHTRLDGAVRSAGDRIDVALADRARLQEALATDPDERLERERDRLDAKLRQMNDALGGMLDRFVDPVRMPSLLEDVIRKHQGLTLTRIQSLPAEPMDLSGPALDEVDATAERSPVWIYRHPMRLEFEGRYFDVLAYLDELERGPWQFGWRLLNYEVRDYPVAKVTLEIETLSREKNWIGV